MKQIVTKFTDNDAYSFSVMYYVLENYPHSEVSYTFFDRNYRKYPQGFGELLKEQVNGMKNVVITEEELEFMKKKMYYLPEWYFDFLRGFRFNPKEVDIFQDPSGYLSIKIHGKWYSALMWEMPILSTISELMHIIKKENMPDFELIYKEAFEKGVRAFTNGLVLSDMGTRRRFSFDVQQEVIRGLKDAYAECLEDGTATGKFVGTSNVWFAKEFDLVPIGTMSHQVISFEECVSGVLECNYNVMDKWSRCYDGNVGIYLYDTFGDKVFFNNLSKRLAKTFDGLRVDSGDEKEQTEKIIDKYITLGIDPSTKAIVYSNALTIDKAIELHKWVNGRMKDSYGIGTHLCADVKLYWCEALGTYLFKDEIKKGEHGEMLTVRGEHPVTLKQVPYSNIVIKLTGMKLNPSRDMQCCVKMSNDKGKTLGDDKKVDFIKYVIGHC